MKNLAWMTCLGLMLACTDAGLDDGGGVCVPGMSQVCTCEDGSMGAQVCESDGGFDECVCNGAETGDSSTGDGDGDSGDGDGDSGDGDGDTGDGDGDSGDGDGDGDGDINPELLTLVTAAPPNGAVGVGHCAIDPDGDIYVTWLQQEGNEKNILLARSTDGGQSFEAPIPVEGGADEPVGGFNAARRPYVATDGQRVAVTYGTVPGNNYSGVRISTSLAPLTLGPLVEVGTPGEADFEDFQRLAFTPEGNIWVVWHKSVIDVSENITVSREEDGWASEDLTGGPTPGQPCECCPLDIRANAAGDTLISYRNNIDNIRDQWVFRDPAGPAGFGAAVPGSSTNWFVPACPLNGPRLSETQGGMQLLTWSDPTSGESRIWVAQSDDGGASWSGDHVIVDSGGAQSSPSITTDSGGRVWVTYDQAGSGRLSASDDDGGTFASAIAVSTDDGELVRMELCSGPTRTGLVGVSPGGSLWWAGL